MRLIAGPLNKQLLQNLLSEVIEPCTRVRAAVAYANGSVAARLWNAIRSDQWAIPHIGRSSLGVVVGWARPDEFPPGNMRTSKGLRALGYNVRIGV